MYIAIDMDRLAFVHKHPEIKVVANLAFIEAPGSVDIVPVDCQSMLQGATETELQKLYLNTTGQETRLHGPQLRAMLLHLADQIPVSDVNPFEVEMQANKCNGNHHGLRYVKGSTTPGRPANLWEPPILKANPTDPISIVAPASPQRSESKETTVPRAGSTRDTIWQVADQLWEEESRPVVPTQVLALRKRIMDTLERQHGVKRTSSSSELGRWQKARI